jgi:hypothetical protein
MLPWRNPWRQNGTWAHIMELKTIIHNHETKHRNIMSSIDIKCIMLYQSNISGEGSQHWQWMSDRMSCSEILLEVVGAAQPLIYITPKTFYRPPWTRTPRAGLQVLYSQVYKFAVEYFKSRYRPISSWSRNT